MIGMNMSASMCVCRYNDDEKKKTVNGTATGNGRRHDHSVVTEAIRNCIMVLLVLQLKLSIRPSIGRVEKLDL